MSRARTSTTTRDAATPPARRRVTASAGLLDSSVGRRDQSSVKQSVGEGCAKTTSSSFDRPSPELHRELPRLVSCLCVELSRVVSGGGAISPVQFGRRDRCRANCEQEKWPAAPGLKWRINFVEKGAGTFALHALGVSQLAHRLSFDPNPGPT